MNIFFIPLGASLVALGYSAWMAWRVLREPAGDDRMQDIAQAIREGAAAYLRRQNRTILMVGLGIAVILFVLFGYVMALGFVAGAVASALAGWLGISISVRANVRVAEEARNGLPGAFTLAYRGGTVTGFCVVGLALLSLTLFWWMTRDAGALIGLAFGASLISVFSRFGGGIFTKGADVAADLVGKIEEGLSEDDSRNPAAIADLVGDEVGDGAGTAADLFETYVVSAVSVMFLTSLLLPQFPDLVMLPLVIGSAAIVASIIGSLFVFLRGKNIMNALYRGLAVAAGLSAVLFWLITRELPVIKALGPMAAKAILFCLLIGIGISAIMVAITEFYTSKRFYPVRAIAQASTAGHGTNVITGMAMGMQSTVLPLIALCAGMLGAYYFAGIYGIGLATMSMVSLAGIIIAADALGPIADNAGGIAEMAHMPEDVRAVTDPLDAVGNTTKTVTKGYAIASAVLAAIVLFASYTQELSSFGKTIYFELADVRVLVGLLIGGMMPYLFGSMALQAVSKAGSAVVDRVRRQLRDVPEIIEGTTKPNYGAAVDIVTKAAIRQMIIPALIPVVIPVAVGFLLGPQTLGGVLVGMIVTGFFMAISMTSGGGSWDNAKKYIEDGHYGGKGSDAYAAAITGDAVGDPYKDTAGPAINPMIKVANIVAILIARFL